MIAILPGQFFSRSTLGFTDNHVAEVFFSSAVLIFFIYSLKAGRELNIKFSDMFSKKKPGDIFNMCRYNVCRLSTQLAGSSIFWNDHRNFYSNPIYNR